MNVAQLKLHQAEEACLIRPATRGEIPEISELVAAAIGAYRGTVSDLVLELYIERSVDFESRWDRGEVLVATQYGRVLGTVTYYAEAADAGFPAQWASFGTLAVHPGIQRRGVASLLVRQCVSRAALGASAIGIHTAKFMPGARQLYEGMGFVRAPEYDLWASQFIAISDADDVHMMGYWLDLATAFSS